MIDASVFDGFDYVALGHIHSPQNVGSERIRYCGTPLKYSFSEASQVKSVTVAEIREKGSLDIKTVPLTPLRDMRELRGSFEQISSIAQRRSGNPEDYLRVILTDDNDIPEAMGKLRAIYPNIMMIEYDNRRTRSASAEIGAADNDNKLPSELFEEFYRATNGCDMSELQRQLVQSLIEKIWEGEQ